MKKNVGKEGAAFLNWVETRRPKKDRSRGILFEKEATLKVFFEFGLDCVVSPRAVFLGKIGIDLWVERAVGSVDDSRGRSGFALVVKQVAEMGRDGRVMAHGDFVEEGWADDIDVGRGGDSAGEKVDGVGPVGFVEALGIVPEIEFIPEISGWNTGIFQLGQGGLLGVDIVNGEKSRDSELLGFGRNETGHPVVAMDDVGFDPGYDVVDQVALKGQG